MGGSYYSRDDYDARVNLRSATAKSKGISTRAATFAYDDDVKSGRASGVHKTLKPTNVMRESRDSDAHPIAVPIAVFMDTTGSMAEVPAMLQEKLTHLMGCFLDDKASGKKYLGDGYPAIMIGAVDDYNAMGGGEGSLQCGQFESGIEIDDNLTNLWLTGQGGGTYEESYDLAMYFAARHTVHDHWEKRHRKGYLFLIGDEHAYPQGVRKEQVKTILGDTIQDDIPLKDIVREAKERYHVFFIIPNMTSHYHDAELEKYWIKLLGQQNVIKLHDPNKICECIAAAVAICEEHIGLHDISTDLGFDTAALVPLSKGALEQHSVEGLPAVPGSSEGNVRL